MHYYPILGSYCSQYEEDVVQVPQRSEFTVLLDPPKCRGWNNSIEYTLSHCNNGECVNKIVHREVTTINVTFTSLNSTSDVTITAINSCGETATVAFITINGK